jgi:hypothetical protein
MVLWVTFDDQTAAALASTVASGTAEIRDGDALETALEMGDCTLLLPASTPGQVLFLQMRTVVRIVAPTPSASPLNTPVTTEPEPSTQFEATGFLGLSDSPVYEDEAPAPKRWWQKLLD